MKYKLALLAFVCACSKPVDHAKLQEKATALLQAGTYTTQMCRVQYEIYLISKDAAHPDCSTADVDTAERQFRWALKDAGLSEQPAKDYRLAFDTARTNIDAMMNETKGGYAARQATNEEKLNEAGLKLASALR